MKKLAHCQKKELTRCWSFNRWTIRDAYSCGGTSSGHVRKSFNKHNAALCLTKSIVSLKQNKTECRRTVKFYHPLFLRTPPCPSSQKAASSHFASPLPSSHSFLDNKQEMTKTNVELSTLFFLRNSGALKGSKNTEITSVSETTLEKDFPSRKKLKKPFFLCSQTNTESWKSKAVK